MAYIKYNMLSIQNILINNLKRLCLMELGPFWINQFNCGVHCIQCLNMQANTLHRMRLNQILGF